MSGGAHLRSTPRDRYGAPGSCEAIDARGGVVEELGLLRRREARGHALERVPEDRVAAARLVAREVRLEHAAVDAEFLDREVVVVPGRVAELLAPGRARALVPSEAVDLHVDAAELGDDVGAGG